MIELDTSKEHFNRLSPAETERLALLLEELGEVQQVIGKILRYGYNSVHPNGGPNNRDLLAIELGDVKAALVLMEYSEDLCSNLIHESMYSKLHKINKYLHHNLYSCPCARKSSLL